MNRVRPNHEQPNIRGLEATIAELEGTILDQSNGLEFQATQIFGLQSQLQAQTKAKEFHLDTIREIYDREAAQAKEIAELKTWKAQWADSLEKSHSQVGANAIVEMVTLFMTLYPESKSVMYHAIIEHANELEKG